VGNKWNDNKPRRGEKKVLGQYHEPAHNRERAALQRRVKIQMKPGFSPRGRFFRELRKSATPTEKILQATLNPTMAAPILPTTNYSY
jgi:hypothetical protein